MALESLTARWPIEQIESVYAYAYEFYNNGHYKESSELFRLLTLVQTNSVRHWMGLGASFQMLKAYEEALEAYSAAALLEETEKDPFPHLHAAECLNALGEMERAFQALESARQIAALDPKYKKLDSQISLLKNAWTKPKT